MKLDVYLNYAGIEIKNTVVMGADIPHSEPMRSAYLTLSRMLLHEIPRELRG